MDDGALYYLIYRSINVYFGLQVRVAIQSLQKAGEKQSQTCLNINFSCMHAHKHTPLGRPPRGSWGLSARAASGERSLWSINRPGPWQTWLASSACQGAKADPAEPFWLWLHAERQRKTVNPEPQSFCPCHYRSLFNRSLAVFTIKTHKQKLMHTHSHTNALINRHREE